jgi:GNAT superfamily N-acetyltransferase
MSEPVILRAAIADDLSGMSALWYEHAALLAQQDPRWVLQPDARRVWERDASGLLDDADVCLLVAHDPVGLVGYIVAAVQPAPIGFSPSVLGVVRSLAVDAHRHSGGAARLLVDGVRAWLRTRGIAQLVVDVPRRAAIEQAFWRAQNGASWMERLWIPS